MFLTLIVVMLLLSAVAPPGLGQQARQSTLRIEVRPECALLESAVEQEPGAEEGVMRFRYAARTGPLGGLLEVRLWEGAGAATISVTTASPAQARSRFLLAPGEGAAAARIPPRSYTAREGVAGEVRWRWQSPQQPAGKAPVISLACP